MISSNMKNHRLTVLATWLFVYINTIGAQTTKNSGSIEVDGSQLEYVVQGEGLPCLVIGSSIYYPRTFSPELRKHLKLYFVDMKWFAKGYAAEKFK